MSTLAAHLDGRLPAAETREVREHLIACEECREIAVESAVALEETEAEAGTVARFPRRWVAAAIAAAILIPLLAITIVLSRRVEDPASLQRLASMAPSERVIETRLSTGEWTPLAVIRGSEAATGTETLLSAAAELETLASERPSDEALHALGVAQMMLGEPEQAEATLEDARRFAGSDRNPILVDYTAALIQNGITRGDRERLERAIEIIRNDLPQPPPPVAQFNLALALEGMGEREAAAEAWRQYLIADSSSGWAEEAKERLARLEGR